MEYVLERYQNFEKYQVHHLVCQMNEKFSWAGRYHGRVWRQVQLLRYVDEMGSVAHGTQHPWKYEFCW